MSEEGQNFKLMVVLMVVLSLVIAAGTSYFMLKQLGGGIKTTEAKRSVTKLGPTHKVGDFIVNLAGGSRYVRLNLSLEVSNEEVISELKKRKPQVRDAIISILRNKEQDDINSQAGTRDLREEIRKSLNKFIPKGEVTNVFFTEFVVQ
ncbi:MULTISPECIES: flagellar basal body-associated FliL family protein [unclassified Candidatus Frackibacter]|uniref:flagellar basal body-associated FliL family protein n=1 Tax=unclassified Candidatus Frackibacter TaxID=2648818 RepID=UPI00088F4693|nr:MULTISPECIES: flagellar basal body-associated FliL family protein [unclassified Candidatus Frackibacter]SDB99458.1 flagellar FliL protein [Candidatus Frackibacter sp. WG11]SEM31099.1 flagellar FliL protein [Candidatus Frackibacter sp. WG12]SFL36072.1 flagellar FliL protein [Candidatus Frackibacter sp. WG13]